MAGLILAALAGAIQGATPKVAYVPRPGGAVDTSAYMWAGYAIAALVYGGYIVLLRRRMARVRKGDPTLP